MTNPVPARFTYLGRPLDAHNPSSDTWIESYPDRTHPRFEVADAGGFVLISVPERLSRPTDLPWPAEGAAPVEIAPHLVAAIEQADPDRADEGLSALREEAASHTRGS